MENLLIGKNVRTAWAYVLISSLSCTLGASLFFLDKYIQPGSDGTIHSLNPESRGCACHSENVLVERECRGSPEPLSHVHIHSDNCSHHGIPAKPSAVASLSDLESQHITTEIHDHDHYGTFETVKDSDSIHRIRHLSENDCSDNSSSRTDIPPVDTNNQASSRLLFVGLATGLSLSLHKLPEGFILFSSGYYGGLSIPREIKPQPQSSLGLLLLFALVIHNFVEGVAIMLPMYLSNPQHKLRSFFIASVLGGLTQPLGAIIAWITIAIVGNENNNLDTTSFFGGLFAFVAGMMLWVTADGMLPAAWSLAKSEREDGNDQHAGKKVV
ncbi:hypothetical protein HK098_006046, partial [Nowakowskiella sp. JEL0407]